MSTSTPWGMSDSKEIVAPGIIFYGTPSHGGYHLSKTRMQKMPANLLPVEGKAHPYMYRCMMKGWFEEDCEWARVALTFPEFFTPGQLENAKKTFESYNA